MMQKTRLKAKLYGNITSIGGCLLRNKKGGVL